jgi:hypothetical protein
LRSSIAVVHGSITNGKDPDGGWSAGDGRHGSMKPGRWVRDNMQI